MIIGISGLANSGKDTAADVLVKEYGYVKVSLADPLKRICRDVFNFTSEQLWGPSEKRNEPDKRYLRPNADVRDFQDKLYRGLDIPKEYLRFADEYLTPRYALQRLGTEWGRDCYQDVWVEYAVRVHQQLQEGDCYYDQQLGIRYVSSFNYSAVPKKGVVIPDVRFKNEIDGLKKAGAKLIRIYRGDTTPQWDHSSETEQLGISDEEFDIIVYNNSTILDMAEYLGTAIKAYC